MNELNASLQLGDVVLFGIPNGNDIESTTRLGTVAEIFNNRTSVRITRDANAPVPPSNAFYLFTKDKGIEASGIIGYEATFTFRNDSTTKAELFAVSTEVFESSR